MDADPPSIALPAPEAGAPAAILFTSGSTGPAKRVTHSFESLGWMFASVANGYALTPDDVMLPASSCSHIAASPSPWLLFRLWRSRGPSTTPS